MQDIIQSFRPNLFIGQAVFVSGGTSGIGLAIARGFAELGADVVAAGSSESKLVPLREDAALAAIRFEKLDVRDTEAVSRLIGAQERIDVLINAAGVARPADEYQEDVFELVMDINLKSAMRLTMAARPQLEAARGVVINIASMLSYLADTAVPAYCASKSGILGLTRALAHELRPKGVRVNAIAPGYHRTDMTKSLWSMPASEEKIAERTALKRWGEAEDLVGAALFLASPAGAYITGETIAVDGGYVSGSLMDGVTALREALGPQVVQLPAEFDGRRFADWSRTPSAEPLAFVRPRNTAEVSAVMRVCHAHRLPVVTQGGLSGLAGGACLLGGEIALSLERMNGIEAIDPVSATMTVLCGTPLQTVQEAAQDAGFLFPLDLGARGSCTIGGNLATNAGGNRVIKYGMMREQVLGLEAVLADGSVVGGLNKMIKNNTGYDLRHLLIGSEGTLAVMTRAVLRLRPKPSAVSTALCGLPDYDAVTTLLARAQSGLPAGVSAFEVMWPGYYDFVLDRLPELRRPLADRHAFYVLLESSGADPMRQAEAFESFLGGLLEEGVVSDAAVAASEADALAFWAIRDAPGEYPKLIPGRTSFDVSFAICDVGDAARRCDAALRERWPEATILIYGHLGDGNIHIVVHIGNEPPKSEIKAIQDVVYAITGELGGSVSAEHGIGLKKLGVIGLTRSAADLAAMKAIKAALDPFGLLNPGKLLG